MSVKSTLTALADEVRELSGKTEKLTLAGMTTEVAGGNAEISDQKVLIAQIAQALEGKAAGGSGSGGGDPELPDGYWRVDYITFSGGQYIDTGIICNQGTVIRSVFVRSSTKSMYFYAVSSEGNKASLTAYMASNGTWRFGGKGVSINVGTGDSIHVAVHEETGVTVDDDTFSHSFPGNFETPGALVLGGGRLADGTVSATMFEGKVLAWEIFEYDEPVQKLVPVTNGNGVYRFYDTVSKAFFDSATDTPLEGGNL